MYNYAPEIEVYIKKWLDHGNYIEATGVGVCNNDMMQSMQRRSLGDGIVSASPLEGILLWSANRSSGSNEWAISLNRLIGHSHHELSVDETIPHTFELNRIHKEIENALCEHHRRRYPTSPSF